MSKSKIVTKCTIGKNGYDKKDRQYRKNRHQNNDHGHYREKYLRVEKNIDISKTSDRLMIVGFHSSTPNFQSYKQ